MSYVNVPVPEHLVAEVMALIVARSHDGSETAGLGSSQPSGHTPIDTSAAWPELELHKLWSESGTPVRATLQLLAANAGKAVASEEIAKLLGKSDRGHAVAGMMGAFGRRLKNRHGGRWPFSVRWNAVAAVWEYMMLADVAAILLQISAASGPEHSAPMHSLEQSAAVT